MNLKSVVVGGFPVVFFDQNTFAGDWRAQMRYCRENGIALYRDIAFASAVADLLELPDDPPSCRPSRLLCLYRSASVILRASLT